MEKAINGSVAVVTGGAQGIGFATAMCMARKGWRLSIWDSDDRVLVNASRKLREITEVSALNIDISDEDLVMAATEETEIGLGPIAGLVHSAGITGPNETVANYLLEDWRKVIDVDLTGAFLVNKHVSRRMMDHGYGRIVNIASVAGKEGNPSAGAYSAAKAGVIALTKSLGKELAKYDIAVNCITPAAAKTRIFEQMKDEHIAYMLSKIPRERFVRVEEVAEMIAWLISPENSFATGGVFDISGGRATY